MNSAFFDNIMEIVRDRVKLEFKSLAETQKIHYQQSK